MLSRDEFVQRAAAVNHYGVDTMYAINQMRVSRAALRSLLAPARPEYRFAQGGTPTPPPAPATHTTVGVDSSAITSAVRAGLASAVFVMDGQVIDVRLDARDAHTARRVRRGA